MKTKKLIAILTVAAAAVQMTAFPSFAEPTEPSISAEFSTENRLPERSELEEAYLEQLFYGDRRIAAYSDYGASRLEGNQKVMYDWLKDQIESIADGTNGSSVLTFNDSAKLYDYSNDGLNQMVKDCQAAFNYILNDLPASFYWYDKTKGISFSGAGSNGELTLTVRMAVCTEYADPTADTYSFSGGTARLGVDASKIDAAKTSVENAKAIASKYSLKYDSEKVEGFRNEICALTSYNHPAADDDSTPYGNPWQLVWVFDGDDSTNVVCEGYSKAFQYLCDLSDVDCFTVDGTMDSGRHMWNIVRLNGKSYLVDVTNCDEGSIGAPDLLCLKGAKTASASSFVMQPKNTAITYAYNSKTIGNYTPELLMVSTEDYKADVIHTHSWGDGTVTKPATCSETGVLTKICKICGETKTEIIPKTAHDYTKYKFDENQHWHVCAVCGNENGDKEAHKFSETVTRQPTTAEAGEKTLVCECGYTKTESIPPIIVNEIPLTFNKPENGKISVTQNGSSINSGGKVKTGDVIGVTLTPNAGCKTSFVKINGAKQSVSGGKTVYTVKSSDQAVKIEAAFDFITPNAVKNFKSSKEGSTKLTVSWTKNTQNTTGYIVNYRSSSKEAWTTKRLKSTASSLNITNLKPNTKYSIAIRAVNGTALSAWTFVNGNEKTALTAPAAVKNFKKTSVTMTTAKLGWSKTACAGYKIYTKAASESGWKCAVAINSAGTTSATLKGLKANTQYSILIRAVSQSNKNLLGDSVSLNIKTSSKPAAVTGFKVKTKTMTTASFTWKKDSEATGYKLWISTNGGKNWKLAATVKANSTAATIKGLKGSTKYTVRIAAINGKTTGAYSDVNFTSNKIPATVNSFKASSVNKTAVTLKWSKSADAASYQIQVSSNGGKSWKNAATVKSDKSSVTIKNLKGGAKYVFRIAAINGKSKSAYTKLNVTTTKK